MLLQVEAELQELEDADAKEYLEGLGVSEGGLRSLISATLGCSHTSQQVAHYFFCIL